ncbi:hypothetical protein V5O48_002859 [Marasmius crinis-equi]|uniref:Uncharacterized protein n=1 Tax=Marasmius crinis-equi TaxID=585013 RepID=A0ABR3FUG6_9AGAR
MKKRPIDDPSDLPRNSPSKKSKLVPHQSFANVLSAMKEMKDIPRLPTISAANTAEVFRVQLLDVQQYDGVNKNPSVLLFGVTEAGLPICIHVHDVPMEHRFYLAFEGLIKSTFTADGLASYLNVGPLRFTLASIYGPNRKLSRRIDLKGIQSNR